MDSIMRSIATVFGVAFLLLPGCGHTLSWQNVPIGAGGFVTGIYADPNVSGLIYISTDVGGAYRWDSARSVWVPITDEIGLNHNSNHFGIESLVVDPTSAPGVPGTVWIYTGTWNWYPAGIYKSTDAGRTWVAKPISGLLADANGEFSFKARGEKLGVDPNNSNIMYLASLNLGLQKSVNGGDTWARVNAVPLGETHEGLSFVAFDRGGGTLGGATAIIYVGVFDRLSANGGVWKSVDAGATWTQMAGGLRVPHRGSVGPNGDFYVTYPLLGTINGGVYKAARTDSALRNITPPDTTHIGYGALAVDPTPGSNAVYVAQLDDQSTYRLHVWRSADGGASWTLANSVIDSDNEAVRTNGDSFLLVGQLAVNPFNSREVWGTDATGVFRTPDITNTATHWSFIYRGHEETFPYDIKSAPVGAPLLSGYLDFPGARHTNVTQYPSSGFIHTSTPTSSGDGPSLDFCENNPNIWVRVVHSWGFGAPGYKSNDGGATWTAFETAPPVNGGRIAISGANPQNFVWLPETGNVYYTLDGGKTWNPAVNAPVIPLGVASFQLNPLAADRVQANTFYLVDIDAALSARIWRSTDGGAHWVVASTIPAYGGSAYNYKIIADPGVAGKIWLDLNNLQGVHKSSDFGATFTRVGALAGSGLIAFGKPAPGRTNASVLFYGDVSGVKGTFLSPDDGATWIPFPSFRFPAVADGPTSLGADRQTYGRAYIGTSGRGLFVGDIDAMP